MSVAVEDCDLVTTDIQHGMTEADKRRVKFKGYQINKHLLIKVSQTLYFYTACLLIEGRSRFR